MKKTIFILFSILLLASAAAAKGSEEEVPEAMLMMKAANNEGSVNSMKADNSSAGEDTMMLIADKDISKSPFDLTGLAPVVIPFTSENDAIALAGDKTVIYFFAAGWCPNCKAAYANIKKEYKTIPSDTVIIVVNYDTESSLKGKYGVSYQHTYVTIDSSGSKKKIWSGSTTVEDILAKAKSM